MGLLRTAPRQPAPTTPAGEPDRPSPPDRRIDVDRQGWLRDHDAAVQQAYERGRHDERVLRRRPRGAPLATLLVLLVAAAGAFAIYLGVSQGSFTRGGQVVDRQLGHAVRTVANGAGDALVGAGRQLKQSASGAA